MQLQISAGQFTDKGVKLQNEDACGIRIPEEPLLSMKGVAAVIADGVSSSSGSREASESCVTGFLSDYYSTPDSWTVKTACQKILGALNRWLYGNGHQKHGGEHGMITTFSAVVIKSSTAHIFHIGDSRVYHMRNGTLECLTRDHITWVDREKSFLSRAMGADINVDIDYRSLPVELGDMFVLTSDGVHEYISHNNLVELILRDNANLENVAKRIVTAALQNGSNDNLTCQLVRITNIPYADENDYYKQLTELPFPPPLDKGNIIDGYKVLREIHASKRTQIYLALDTETQQKVILKTPSVNFDDDAEYIEQFRHEEWVGKRLDNLHVLKVIRNSRPRRFLYMVTEYIEGQTLRQWMHDHPRPQINQVREIVQQIAAGLRNFHRMEMLHQDLKPENIMIDEHGVVKIIDFGSAKIAGLLERNTPVKPHNIIGTRNYTAPEYLSDARGSTRSDIFSLGVITYEMLTGRLPYGNAMERINNVKQLSRLKYTPAYEHNEEIPVWLDRALQKAVTVDQATRYSLLSEFTHDISKPNPQLLTQTPVPLIERNPLLFWKGLALVLFITNVVLVYLLAS